MKYKNPLTLNQIKKLTLNSKLTLEQFIYLFNDVCNLHEDNPLWNNFYLEFQDPNTHELVEDPNDCIIVPRNTICIHD